MIEALKRNIAAVILIVSSVSLFVFFGLPLVGRLGQVPPCFLIEDKIHHRYQPNCEGEFHPRGGQDQGVHYRFNSEGYREREISTFQGKPNVLVVGDSDVEGHGLEAEDTISQKLAAKIPSSAFFNAGLRFTGPYMQRLRILDLLGRLKPKSVLWFLCENDFLDDRLFESLTSKKDGKGLPLEFSIRDFLESKIPGEAIFKSLSLGQLYSFLSRLNYMRVTNRLLHSVPEDAVRSCAVIAETVKAIEATGASLRMGIIPLGPYNQDKEALPSFERIVQCLPKNIPVLDFRNAMGRERKFFFEGDTHINAKGTDLIVEQIVSSWGR